MAQRRYVILAFILLATTGLHGKPKPVPIPVCFIQPTPPEGFVDAELKQRQDSYKDVLNELTKMEKDGEIVFVEAPEQAKIVLEILDRGSEDSGSRRVTRGALTGQVGSSPDRNLVVHLQLTAGTYQTVFNGVSSGVGEFAIPTWRGAAGNAVWRLKKWIKDNRAKLN
jgi:hypothetical protein